MSDVENAYLFYGPQDLDSFIENERALDWAGVREEDIEVTAVQAK